MTLSILKLPHSTTIRDPKALEESVLPVRFVLRAVFVISCFVPGLTLTPTMAGHSPRFRDVLVASDRTEPTIVSNPKNPRNIVAGANPDYDEHNPAGATDGYFYSGNGGNSWRGSEMPVVQPWTTEADPWMVADSHGVIYYAYLGEAPTSYCTTGTTAILLSRSTDGGRHFRYPVIVDGGAGLHDRPVVAVRSYHRWKDHVYVTWSRPMANGRSQIFFQRSLDGGAHFSHAVLLEQSRWPTFGAEPVVGPRGRVTVVWATFRAQSGSRPMPERIMSRTSFNDGRSWKPKSSPSRGYFRGIATILRPGDLRVLPSPSAAVTSTGRVFVAWARVRHVWPDDSITSDIVVSRSTGGLRWSRSTVVNDNHHRDRFMPALAAIGPHSLGAVFYDRRGGYQNLAVYATRIQTSPERLRHGRNVRLSGRASPIYDIAYVPSTACYEPGRFFGDYISATVDRWGYFHAIWADTQRQIPNITDIWSASLRL